MGCGGGVETPPATRLGPALPHTLRQAGRLTVFVDLAVTVLIYAVTDLDCAGVDVWVEVVAVLTLCPDPLNALLIPFPDLIFTGEVVVLIVIDGGRIPDETPGEEEGEGEGEGVDRLHDSAHVRAFSRW